jgi:autotransporter-associated beta strand protein
VLPENFYESQYGSDINFHTWQAGLIEMTGVDHYTDPSLDTASIAHTVNFRGINIEGANVQWGNGSTDRFFLPATPSDSYINIHNNGSLAFDYDGPVTLDTPISGGVYHNSLSTPAYASISLAATDGNAVTFAVPMNYHGTTTIGSGATLLLGTGESGGDSSLLTGASGDQVVDDGTLTVRNVSTGITVANVSGSGGLTQSGAATTTLAARTTTPGRRRSPRVLSRSGGPAAPASGRSSSLRLSAAGTTFDVASAGSGRLENVRQLSGVAGSAISLGSNTLSVSTSGTETYAGSITGTSGGLTTTGSGTLTLTGHVSTPGGALDVKQGTLAVGAGGAVNVGSLIQSAGSTLSLAPGDGRADPGQRRGSARWHARGDVCAAGSGRWRRSC